MAKSTVAVRFTGDVGQFKGALSDVDGKLSGLGSKISGLGKVAAAGLAAGAVGAVALGKSFVDAAVESEKIGKQTDAVLKSMGGAASLTAKDVGNLANELSMMSGVDDELIQSASNVLLTFGKVRNEVGKGNDIFDRAQKSALDMSVALGTDLQGATTMLGKALNDPIAGITAMSRAGVSFTEQQKDQIKTMVESGDTLGAQKLIMAEMEAQFGGSAEAQATAGDKLKVAFGNLQETIGAYLLPVVERLSTFLAENLQPAFEAIGKWISDNRELLIALAAAIGGALVVAFGAWAVSAGAAAAATIAAMAPVIAIGAAVAALVGGLVYAYQEWDGFRNVIDTVARFITGTLVPAVGAVISVIAEWIGKAIELAGFLLSKIVPAAQAVAGFVTGTLVPAVAAIIGKFGDWIGKAIEVATAIKDKFTEVVDFVTGLPGKISRAASGMWDGIKNAFKAAINWIIRAWNGIEFKIPGFDPPGPGPTFGGFTLGLPNIPELAAEGAIFKHTPGGLVTRIAGKGDEAVVPLKRGASTGSGVTIVVQGSIIDTAGLIKALGQAPGALAQEVIDGLYMLGKERGLQYLATPLF